MKPHKPTTNVHVSTSRILKAGRGVFASVDIRAGQLIERCPVITLPASEYRLLKKTHLRDYFFLWGSGQKTAIALGFGTLYNHAWYPNATYKKELKKNMLAFYAIRPIKKGEEITVNYNEGVPGDLEPLWVSGIAPPNNLKKKRR